MVKHEIQLGLGLEIAALERTLVPPGREEQASPLQQGWCTSTREKFAISLWQTQVARGQNVPKAIERPTGSHQDWPGTLLTGVPAHQPEPGCSPNTPFHFCPTRTTAANLAPSPQLVLACV